MLVTVPAIAVILNAHNAPAIIIILTALAFEAGKRSDITETKNCNTPPAHVAPIRKPPICATIGLGTKYIHNNVANDNAGYTTIILTGLIHLTKTTFSNTANIEPNA